MKPLIYTLFLILLFLILPDNHGLLGSVQLLKLVILINFIDSLDKM